MKNKHYLSVLFFLLGIALFIGLILQTDLHQLWERLKTIKPQYFLLVVCYAFVWRCLHALAFYILCALKNTQKRVYILVQILSNTISDIFPLGNTGGEVYRAYKMGSYYPQYKDLFIGRTILYNTFYAVAILFVFLTSGLYLTLNWDLPPLVQYLFLGVISLLFILSCLLLFLQSRGLLHSLIEPFTRLPILTIKKIVNLLLVKVRPIDETMRGFTPNHYKRVILATSLLYLSRLLTIAEVIFIGWSLGIPISFGQAVLINMVDIFIKIAFFFFPNGQLGVLEASIISLGSMIGQSPAVMLSFSLVQRARALVWDGIGIILLVLERIKGWLYARKMDV